MTDLLAQFQLNKAKRTHILTGTKPLTNIPCLIRQIPELTKA